LKLNPALPGLGTKPVRRKRPESNQRWSIINRTGNDVWHFGAFVSPVPSKRRTGFFGENRVYQYSDGTRDVSVHAGIDYGVPKGTDVIACGRGRVVLARHRIVTGNSVIIEHAPGIYSLYYHLKRIIVQENTLVQTGTQIGEVGATGLATGPHLHWEIRVSGENTDPDILMQRPLLDKDAIMDKLKN